MILSLRLKKDIAIPKTSDFLILAKNWGSFSKNEGGNGE